MSEPVPPKPIYKRKGRPPVEGSTAELRECRRHGLIEHHLYSSGPARGKRWKCKRCVGEAVTRRHHKIRKILIAEAGGCCKVCGYDRLPTNLHFHHVDPSTKSFNVNPSQGKALDAYRAEARKCVLVCANCHYEIEAGLIPCPPLSVCWGPAADGPVLSPAEVAEFETIAADPPLIQGELFELAPALAPPPDVTGSKQPAAADQGLSLNAAGRDPVLEATTKEPPLEAA